jgi:E3 ubiquitin-protein ligase HACE1
VGCLRVLHELGVSLATATPGGLTPAHNAASRGHEGCLRVLHELGGAAALSATQENGSTVAHSAAQNAHVACLRVLHECLRASFEPIVVGLRGLPSDTTSAMVRELEERMVLAYSHGRRDGMATPAASIFAAPATTDVYAKLECYRYLDEIGGTAKLVAWLSTNPSRLAVYFAPLLTEPRLLDLKTKQAWLVWKLKAVVGNANAAELMLVAHRGKREGKIHRAHPKFAS